MTRAALLGLGVAVALAACGGNSGPFIFEDSVIVAGCDGGHGGAVGSGGGEASDAGADADAAHHPDADAACLPSPAPCLSSGECCVGHCNGTCHGVVCGDGICDPPTETPNTCPQDCHDAG